MAHVDMPDRDAADALSSQLAWETWLDEYNCHITQQGNIYAIYELKPIGSAYMTDVETDAIVTTINHMLLRFIPGVSCSLMAKVDSSIEHILHAYETYGGRDKPSDNPGRQLCRDIVKKTANYYREATRYGFRLRPENKLRATRLFLTVLVPNPKRNKRLSPPMRRFMHAIVPDPATHFFSPQDAWKKQVKAEITRMAFQLKSMHGIVKSSFSEAGLNPTRLGRVDAENLMYQMRNPYRSSRPGFETIRTNDNEFLRYQLSYDGMDDTPDGLVFEGKKIGVVTSMKIMPIETDSGHFSKLLENIVEGHLTINFTVQQASSVSRNMMNKQQIAQLFSMASETADAMYQGISEFKRNMGDGSILPISFQVIDVRWFDVEDVDIQTVRENILTQWQSLSGNGHSETMFAKGMWMRSLPGCYNSADAWFDRREQLVQSIDLANMFPIFWSWAGNWKGNMPDARQLRVNRRNELVPISKWANEAGHGFVVGTTRTGKSVYMEDVIGHDLSCDDTNVYVVDVGDSYGALVMACGDQFAQQVYFDLNKPICFNPFYLANDVDIGEIKPKVKDAVSIVASMMIQNPDVDQPTAEQLSVIMEAALKTMTEAHKGNYEAELGKHFIPNLRKVNKAGVNGNTIADTISPFYGEGIYAGFFDGKHAFHSDLNFIVFELGKVKDDTHLMSPLFLVILSFLRSLFYEIPLSIEKNIYIDESHNLMHNEMAARMVNGYYAEAAKFNCAISMMTQNLFKFLDFPGGRNILGQANHGVILSQDMEQTRATSTLLGLSNLKLDAISDVRKQKDRAYSELLYTDAIGTVEEKGDYLRFYCEPTLLALYGTNANERLKRIRLSEQYPDKSLMEIAEMAREIDQ